MSGQMLQEELVTWLNAQTITSETIGDIRRQCFMPWDSKWNGMVRDETAARELPLDEDGTKPVDNSL